MERTRTWREVVVSGICGACTGVLFGAFLGGIAACVINYAVEWADPLNLGRGGPVCFLHPIVFVAGAVFCAPAVAVAGATGAITMRRSWGALAGVLTSVAVEA